MFFHLFLFKTSVEKATHVHVKPREHHGEASIEKLVDIELPSQLYGVLTPQSVRTLLEESGKPGPAANSVMLRAFTFQRRLFFWNAKDEIFMSQQVFE